MVLAADLDTESLGAVLKTALDAVLVMRLDGTIAGWNDVAERTFGWSFAEARDRRMSEMIVPHRHRAGHERGLAHYLKTGDGPVLDRHLELEALHRDGHEMPVELSITRTHQLSGEPVFLGFLRDISERKAAERRQELLVGELNHRVKNLLGVVSGIAHQTVRSSASLSDFTPAFTGRLSSLGRAMEILTAASWEQASLTALADALLGPYKGGDDRVTIVGPDLMLAPRQLMSLSMILHELITNAVKYGALSAPEGKLSLFWTIADEQVSLSWIESGLMEVKPPVHHGFGTRMIAMSVQHELRSVVDQTWRPDGMAFSVTFKREQEVQA